MQILRKIEKKLHEGGWSNLLQSTVRKLSFSVLRVYSNVVLRNKFLSKRIPFKQPPILVLSYPRSGSSWVGEILQKSKNAAYLREPVTTRYLASGGTLTMIDLNDKVALSLYQKSSDESFMGIPSKMPGVVIDYKDFVLFKRKRRRIVIKEVNPRAAKFYCERYKPKVILILRHPAALALSFQKMGWLEAKDTQMETGNLDSDKWEKFGFAYGYIMKEALDVLLNKSKFKLFLGHD